ncbi:hypothetical protein [Maribacter aestuarii]|uniref:hypothetical protein n=1 Tax=Maribacter aestuarii TaxID=1130723 RepID=UPI00248CB032|nr:hypothetical protein [Maribacter aestuarii]
MKYLKYILGLSLLIALVSCSSDDGATDSTATPLVVGTWSLTEVNVSIPQDPNDDGTASTNMVDELPCLTGLLIISENGNWTASITDVSITPITGDLYAIQCEQSISYSGNWSFQNNVLSLNRVGFSPITLSGDTLRESRNEDLPGIQSLVYTRQP